MFCNHVCEWEESLWCPSGVAEASAITITIHHHHHQWDRGGVAEASTITITIHDHHHHHHHLTTCEAAEPLASITAMAMCVRARTKAAKTEQHVIGQLRLQQRWREPSSHNTCYEGFSDGIEVF